jgi:hypothetical protein
MGGGAEVEMHVCLLGSRPPLEVAPIAVISAWAAITALPAGWPGGREVHGLCARRTGQDGREAFARNDLG